MYYVESYKGIPWNVPLHSLLQMDLHHITLILFIFDARRLGMTQGLNLHQSYENNIEHLIVTKSVLNALTLSQTRKWRQY